MVDYPFTLTDDCSGNDSRYGLTSDSTSSGGVLAPPMFFVETDLFTTSFATASATTSGSATVGAVTTDAVVSASVAEAGSTTVAAAITEASASPFASGYAVIFESGETTATVEPVTITEVGRATESPSVSVNASPFVSAIARITEENIYTESSAKTTVIIIRPLPRMGLDVTESSATIKHGTNFDT